MFAKTILLVCTSFVFTSGESSSAFDVIKRLCEECLNKEDFNKCFKIQALKVADRALHSSLLPIYGGISIISNNRLARSLQNGVKLNDSSITKMNLDQVEDLLVDTTGRFLDSHQVEISIPKVIEEARRRKKGGGGMGGALLWALAIKGSFLAMAYKGIAIMSGTALIVGKMALLLSAILGLKKIVSSGHEKTTFEIVKHPQYSESHTHSTSYEDDGHYRRTLYLDDPVNQKTAYKYYAPE